MDPFLHENIGTTYWQRNRFGDNRDWVDWFDHHNYRNSHVPEITWIQDQRRNFWARMRTMRQWRLHERRDEENQIRGASRNPNVQRALVTLMTRVQHLEAHVSELEQDRIDIILFLQRLCGYPRDVNVLEPANLGYFGVLCCIVSTAYVMFVCYMPSSYVVCGGSMVLVSLLLYMEFYVRA